MKAMFYRTYNSTPLGVKVGKWSRNITVHSAGTSGWYVSVTLPWFTGRYQFQLRRDVF